MASKKKSSKKASAKAKSTTTTKAKATGLCSAGCGVEQIPGATFCHHCNVPQ